MTHDPASPGLQSAGLQGALRQLMKHTRSAEPAALVPVDRDHPLPLSFAQQRLWLVDRLAPGAAYNVPLALRMRGPLDLGLLGDALSAVVRRHEVLRTVFAVEDGQPVQVIRPAEAVTVTVAEACDEPSARELVAEEIARPFDLAHGPLVRMSVVRLAADDHVVVLTMHHVVTDAWSQGVLWSDFAGAYASLRRRQDPRLPALPVQYADFAAWQRQWLSGSVLEREWGYWERRLAGFSGALDLPTDRVRPALMSYEAGSCEWLIPAESVRAARALGERENATLFMVLLAVFQLSYMG